MTTTRCYMVIVAEITDRPRFLAGYARAVPELVARHGGRYLIRGAGGRFLEEGWCDSPNVLVSEWPDRAAAERFWHSHEYRELKALRAGTGRFQVLLIDAPALPPPSED
jgi:uncharacterized protein (DUF1330 family)